MYCPRCGTPVPDSSKFCGACGKELSVSVKSKVKLNKKIIIGAMFVIAIVVLFIIAVAVKFLVLSDDNNDEILSVVELDKEAENLDEVDTHVSSSDYMEDVSEDTEVENSYITNVENLVGEKEESDEDNVCVYFSNSQYELLTNLNQDQSIPIGSSKYINSESLGFLKFTSDGKYVYYFTDWNDGFGTGTLCRAESSKLTEENNKNIEYIDIVSENVSYNFSLLDDGSSAFMIGSALYYYNGEKVIQVAETVTEYYVDKSGRLIYATGVDYENYKLYGVILSNSDDKTELASEIYKIYDNIGTHILFGKLEDDSSRTLYAVDFNLDVKKIGEDVNYLGSKGEKAYFIAGSILCSYKNGVVSTIHENVLAAAECINATMFYDLVAQSVYFVLDEDNTVYQLSDAAHSTLLEKDVLDICFVGEEVYMLSDSGLFMAKINNGLVDDFTTIISDSWCEWTLNGADLYYREIFEDNGHTYCNVYSCSNGISVCLASSVKSCKLYDDGVIIAYNGFLEDLGYELTLVNASGEKTWIADAVTKSVRVDESTLMYISDGNLYCYNGKEKQMIAADVSYFWCQNSLDIVATFGPFYGGD